jgi:hypothetical protein
MRTLFWNAKEDPLLTECLDVASLHDALNMAGLGDRS